MADPTDAEVLAQVRRGDHGAYMLLFERHYAPVERYALCLLGDGAAAARAASAAFEQGFRNARQRRAAAYAYPAHLFMLCRRYALRAASRRKGLNLSLRLRWDPDDREGASLDELPLSVILCRERDALVLAALDALTLEDREIIHLAFEPVLAREDVGIILGQRHERNVTANLHRALRRLGAAVLHSGYAMPQTKEGSHTHAPRWSRT